MSRQCIVEGCNKYSNRFKVPTDETIAAKWLKRSGNNTSKQKIRVICPRHFSQVCLMQGGSRVRKCALPSLFLPDYTPRGDDSDNFCYPKSESSHTPANITAMLQLPSTSGRFSPVEKMRTPKRTYSRRKGAHYAAESPSSSTALFEVEGVEPLGEIIEELPSCDTALFEMEGVESLSEISEDEFVDVCRICLKPTSESIKFSQQNRDSILYERMVEFVFPDLKINMYPDPAICVHCEAELQRAYHFKNLWSRSEHILQEFVSKQTQDKDITKTLLLDFVANSSDKLLELGKDPGNKDLIVDDPVDVEIAGQDCVRNHEILEDSVMVQENNGDSDDVQQIIPDEHDYCQPEQNQIFSIRRKLPIPDIYNLLDEKYDLNFAEAVCLHYGELELRLRKLRRPDPGEPPYLCEICGHVFTTYVQCQRHLERHKTLQSRVDFVCEICGLSFSNTNLRHHYSTHKPRNYTCNVCNRKFLSGLQLRRHAESGQHERKYGQCHLCGKKVTRDALRAHLLSHKTVQCQVCEKVLSKSAIARHLKWHREGGYKCPLCVKVLKNKYCLNIHIMAVHDKKNDFKCGVCGKGYSLKCRLKRHITKTHLNSNQQKKNVSAVTKSQEEICMQDDNET